MKIRTILFLTAMLLLLISNASAVDISAWNVTTNQTGYNYTACEQENYEPPLDVTFLNNSVLNSGVTFVNYNSSLNYLFYVNASYNISSISSMNSYFIKSYHKTHEDYDIVSSPATLYVYNFTSGGYESFGTLSLTTSPESFEITSDHIQNNITNISLTQPHRDPETIGSSPQEVYEVLINTPPPVVTLLSQTPSVIYQNSTGYMNISYGISHDSSGLNNTSISFIYRNYDPACGCSNQSIRPPTNDLATEWDVDGRILRAANRNETLNFENNATITGGDTYSWSGLDENSSRLTIVPVNSTYTMVYINATVHDVMPNMWYLDRTNIVEAPKTKIAIHKSQNLLIKFWELELFKGNTDFLDVGYVDTDLKSSSALYPDDVNPINYYYVNDSYDPATGGDPITSGYAVYMGSKNATEWIDYVYEPHTNSSYTRGFINNSLLETYINTTNISYIYFTSNTPSAKPFYINATNVASGTNVSFADTGVMWTGDATLTQQSYTPNIWFAFMKGGITFDHKLYVADNNSVWENSTLSSTVIGGGLFPPTNPSFYAFHNGYTDHDMNGTYNGEFTIQIGRSSDPDGGNVSHNLTLHYSNETLIDTIVDVTCKETCTFLNATFDSTPYSTLENYTLRVVATDDEGESATVWLGVNFTINYDNFTFSNAAISPTAVRENSPFTVSVDIADIDGTITEAIVKISSNNYTMTNTAGDTWSYTFTDTSLPTEYYVTDFYAKDDFGEWNTTTSTLTIDVVSSTGTGGSGGISPVVTPIPIPDVNVTPENVSVPIHNISGIIQRTMSDEKIKVFKINFYLDSKTYEKSVYIENAISCNFTSDVITACNVENEIVTIKFKYEPDGVLYRHSDGITVYGEEASRYIGFDIYVLNFYSVWWFVVIFVIFCVVLYPWGKKK